MGVTIGGFHLENTASEFQDGDIECTTTQVINSDLHVFVLLVKTIGKGCRGRLVYDTLDIESGDLTGLLRSLALRIREICRYRNDGLGDILAQIILSCLLHLLEDHCRNLLR